MGRGATPEDAIKRIIQMRSPEYQRDLKAKSNSVEPEAEIAKVTSLFDLDGSFAGDPVSMAVMFMTYREVAKERLLATGDVSLAKAQALDQLRPIARLANASAEHSDRGAAIPESGPPSLAMRAWYNALASFYRGTSLGAAIHAQVAAERRAVESGATDEELLREFYPALLANRPDQRGHREAALRSLRSAPQRHKDILADLARYDAMKGYSSMAEAAAALIGQIGGALPTPETGVGPIGKGATWGTRFVSGAWRGGLTAAAVDPAVQALSIAGGGQEKYDPWRAATSVGLGSLIGGVGSALFGRRLEPGVREVSASAPHAPETLPPGVKGEEPALVASAPEAQASGGKMLAADASVPQSGSAVPAPNTLAQQPTAGRLADPGTKEHLREPHARLENQDALYEAALQKMNAEYTHAGRALTKHPELVGATKETLRQTLRSDSSINEAGQEALKKIMRDGVMTVEENNRFGKFTVVKIPGGFGARWTLDGKFIGFINPRR